MSYYGKHVHVMFDFPLTVPKIFPPWKHHKDIISVISFFLVNSQEKKSVSRVASMIKFFQVVSENKKIGGIQQKICFLWKYV